jgi:hypothetical protein
MPHRARDRVSAFIVEICILNVVCFVRDKPQDVCILRLVEFP